MIRQFTRKQLEEKAKTRPEGYMEAVLAAAKVHTDGTLLLETDSPEYKKIVEKFVIQKELPPGVNAMEAEMAHKIQEAAALNKKPEAPPAAPPGPSAPPPPPPPHPAETVIQNRELFEEVFPGIGKIIDEAATSTCVSCSGKKKRSKILQFIKDTDKTGKNMDKLIKVSNPILTAYLLNSTKDVPEVRSSVNIKKPRQESTESREGCIDCVCKHLSQASILLDECLQGYPEHVELASKHIESALKLTHGGDAGKIQSLKNALTELEKVVKDKDEKGAVSHLLKARQLVNSLLSASVTHPLTVWKLIGHLGEAADECVEIDPELAADIREERIKLMENLRYRPVIDTLLNRARRTLNDSRGAENGQ